MSHDSELELWQQQWREQPVAMLDVTALRQDARRRNRREKFFTALEIVIGALVSGLCLWSATMLPAVSMLHRVGVALLALLVIGFTAWAVRARLRHWQDSTLDVAALIRLEQRRLNNRIRYWRVNGWLAMGLWTGVAILAIYNAGLPAEHSKAAANWFLSMIANFPVVLGSVLWSYHVYRQCLERKRELDAYSGDTH